MKINKNHREIMQHIQQVIGINVEPVAQALKRRMIAVDVSCMSEGQVNAIYRVADTYGVIEVESNGYKALAISLV